MTTFSLPLNDAGSGIANITPAVALGSPTPTFTRATPAWTINSAGIHVQVASGQPRSYYRPDTLVYQGYLSEWASTNICLWSNDMTNAVWAKTNMTTAFTSVAPDNSANSASRCTATAANATCLQTITSTSTQKPFSLWVKRITGTGNFEVTAGNGVYVVVPTTANWTKVEAAQTQLNPVVGFRIATSGDAFDIWCCQEESNTSNPNFSTSPIPTTTAPVTRNEDILTYLKAGNASQVEGTLFCRASIISSGLATNQPYIIGTNSNDVALNIRGSTSVASFDGVSLASATTGAFVLNRYVSTWKNTANKKTGAISTLGTGNAYNANGIFSGASFGVGNGVGGTKALNGCVRDLEIDNLQLNDTDLLNLLTTGLFPATPIPIFMSQYRRRTA